MPTAVAEDLDEQVRATISILGDNLLCNARRVWWRPLPCRNSLCSAAMRAGIDDDTIARCLMDERRPFGGNTRVSERLLDRVIAKAHQYADDPVLEEMNRDFAAGFIGGKFRVAKFDQHPRFQLQRHIEFLTKTDFINGVRNPRVEVVDKFKKAGKPGHADGTPRRILVQLARPQRI